VSGSSEYGRVRESTLKPLGTRHATPCASGYSVTTRSAHRHATPVGSRYGWGRVTSHTPVANRSATADTETGITIIIGKTGPPTKRVTYGTAKKAAGAAISSRSPHDTDASHAGGA
jgi:hypothetical protein